MNALRFSLGSGQSFAEAFDSGLLDMTTASWSFWLGLLHTYHADYGDCLVPGNYTTTTGERLGQWVSHQRKRKAFLLPDRLTRLEALGFV